METDVLIDNCPASQAYQSDDGESDNDEKINFCIIDEKDSYDVKMKKVDTIISYCKIEPDLLFDFLQDLLKSKSSN